MSNEATKPDPAPTPTESPQQAALLAMDAGINDEPMPDIPGPEAAKDPPAPASPPAPDPAAPADPAEPAKPGSPEARAADIKAKDGEGKPAGKDGKPADPKPGEPAADDPAKAAADAEIAKEADSLGLKDKARERFTSLVNDVKAAAPYREAAEKLGIKSPEQLAQLAERASVGVDMVEMIRSTGATPQQYDMTLNYLDQVNKGINGDVKAASQCWNWLMEELATLAPIVGKEVPGIVDPLKDHADLQREVENGDISRARALELAQQRAAAKARENADLARKQQADQQKQTEEQKQAAVQKGRESLTALGNELAAADPAAYQAKFPMLAHIVKTEIVPKHPPGEWAQRAAMAWAKIVTMPAAPAPAPNGGGRPAPAPAPVRPGGPTPPALPEFNDPMQALNAALDLPD